MRVITATLVITAMFASTASAGVLGDAAVIAAASADVVSTHVAMQRGGQEVNTVSSLKGQAALHVAVAGVSILMAHEAEKNGHKGWAKACRIVPVVIFSGAAAWNLSKGGR